MSINEEFCANCSINIFYAKAIGVSSIYNAQDKDFAGQDILLCEPCFFIEENEINVAGSNNLPHALDHYRQVLRSVGEL